LAERLNRIAGALNRRPDVLIQVDLAHEPTNSGADEQELPAVIETLDAARHLNFRGLMTLPPFFETPEQTRPFFRRLRELIDSLNRNRESDRQLTELSMGMSHDFEVAIEEGATMVRVGTAIFGSREVND
jgi:pyridoxal phosphate enzyme (YggS family)